MSDPDLYSTDPWRREAARARQNSSTPTPYIPPTRNTNTSSGFDNSPKLTQQDYENLGAGAELLFKGVGVAIEAVIAVTFHLPFIGIKYILDKKSGRSFSSNDNNTKAGVLTAAFLSLSAAAGIGVYAYNQALNERYPSIAITFNSNGRAYISSDPYQKQAYTNSITHCNQAPPFFTSACQRGVWIQAGQPICINFNSAELHRSNRFQYHLTSSRPSILPKGYRTVCNFTP